jgi:hypothetical protein
MRRNYRRLVTVEGLVAGDGHLDTGEQRTPAAPEAAATAASDDEPGETSPTRSAG